MPISKTPTAEKGMDLHWPLPEGITIRESSWVSDSGLQLYGGKHSDNTTSIMVDGGEAGKIYTLKNIIRTSEGKVMVEQLEVSVSQEG